MLYKKTGFPEESEVVLCTVEKIMYHSVFVRLDEYDMQGMIHISEISPGRIRNIRDFVKEGKKIVCKVLRLNRERNQIDLSLRRVSEIQKRDKINQLKQEQLAEKIIEYAATKSSTNMEELYKKISEYSFLHYGFIYTYFEEVSKDEALINKVVLDKKVSKLLVETIKQRIKPPKVKIIGEMKITLYNPDGIELIRSMLLGLIESNKSATITYDGGGRYKVEVIEGDWKTAEKIFEGIDNEVLAKIKKLGGEASMVRVN